MLSGGTLPDILKVANFGSRAVEAFAKLADSPQQKTVIVPAEMGARVGSLAGVGELVKTIRTDDPPRRPAPASAPPRAARGAVPPTGA